MSHYRYLNDDNERESANHRWSRASSIHSNDDVDRIVPAVEYGSSNSHLANAAADARETSSTEQQLVSETAKRSNVGEKSSTPLLRYRRTSVWLLACYLPFLILPWILTNIMAYRPPSLPSYNIQKPKHCFTRYLVVVFWFAFVRILNSIASVLVVPVTSALLAHGAVVFTQRRKAHQQKLNLRQTFALSDRGWNDIPILWSAYKGKGTLSRYLKAGACLSLLSAVQAPVQQALISYELVGIMTCGDHPFNGPPVVGYDPEPQALAMTPQTMVVTDVIKSLATVTDMDTQPYLWPDTTTDWSTFLDGGDNNALANTFWAPYKFDQNLRYFVTAFPNNTNTGVLREHIMRLNSTAQCKAIDETAFPDTCPGVDPLVVSYSSEVTSSYSRPGNFSIDVCVPGNLSASPWTLSRDRQDITEDIYIKVHVDYQVYEIWGSSFSANGPPANFTVHCMANTTRGYFELPNWSNDFTPGPLLEKWLDKETLENDFNDYLYDFQPVGIPSTIDHYDTTYEIGNWYYPIDPFDTNSKRTPGLLATSALAMFGRGSFFYVGKNASGSTYPTVTQQICQAGNIPFLRLDGLSSLSYDEIFSACYLINNPYNEVYLGGYLDQMLYQWVATFKPGSDNLADIGDDNRSYSEEALEVAMYFANLHWLMETATATKYLYSARNIWSSPGLGVAKPVVKLYAKITVSILIALQLFGLGVLMRYIYYVPTWTEKLDSCAIAQLTNDVNCDIFSTIRKPDEKALQELKGYSGLVGIAEENTKHGTNSTSDGQEGAPDVDTVESASSHSNREDANVEPYPAQADEQVVLVRHGPGFITKQHGSFKEWKPNFKRMFKRRKATKESILEKGPN